MARRIIFDIPCDGCKRAISGEESAWHHRGHAICNDCRPTVDRPCQVCGGFESFTVKARLGTAFAKRLVEFGERLAKEIEEVAHAKDQDRLFDLMDRYHDVLQPAVRIPDGGSQLLQGAVGEEHGFAADEYIVSDDLVDSVMIMSRMSGEVVDD